MDTTWILVIATLGITFFLTYVRIKDYLAHRKLLASVTEKEKLTEKIKRPGQRLTLYLFGAATIIFGIMTVLAPTDLWTNLSYITIFVILCLSEVISILTQETLFVFDKTVVYAVTEFKIRNIRTMAASGKRNTSIAMMDGSHSVVPNDVGEKLTALMKARKAK